MDILQKANVLVNDTNAIMSRPDRDAAFWKAAQSKAVEISDFLSEHGTTLDAAGSSHMVDALGNCVDALAGGAASTRNEADQSSTAAGLLALPSSYVAAAKDAVSAAGEAVGSGITGALKSFLKTPGGMVVGATAAIVFGVWVWRRIK